MLARSFGSCPLRAKMHLLHPWPQIPCHSLFWRNCWQQKWWLFRHRALKGYLPMLFSLNDKDQFKLKQSRIKTKHFSIIFCVTGISTLMKFIQWIISQTNNKKEKKINFLKNVLSFLPRPLLLGLSILPTQFFS